MLVRLQLLLADYVLRLRYWLLQCVHPKRVGKRSVFAICALEHHHKAR